MVGGWIVMFDVSEKGAFSSEFHGRCWWGVC